MQRVHWRSEQPGFSPTLGRHGEQIGPDVKGPREVRGGLDGVGEHSPSFALEDADGCAGILKAQPPRPGLSKPAYLISGVPCPPCRGTLPLCLFAARWRTSRSRKR
jgi:hypothetical protein